MGRNKNTEEPIVDSTTTSSDDKARFKLVKSKIKEMYKDDRGVKTRAKLPVNTGVILSGLTSEELFSSKYFLSGTSVETPRQYASQAYVYYPIYASIIDYLANMYTWNYTFIPRYVKNKEEKAPALDEIYPLMSEVVDGLSIETTFPLILTSLYVDGCVYLITKRTTASKTISTLKLPSKYCRPITYTQYGTIVYQFNFQYFDDLGLSSVELEKAWELYPDSMREQYNLYKQDAQNYQWQMLDPKFAAAISQNDFGFPTKLFALSGIVQYRQYLDNELERNGQLLDKIVTHKIPTWQDKLVLDIDEVTELHNSMANMLTKHNKHVRLFTSFGDMKVETIGEDQSQENKTLTNAYNAIYDGVGLNHSVFNGESVEALKAAMNRDKSLVWKAIQQIVSFYNIVINNSFNFKGYQCDISILPITQYDKKDMLQLYKDGATLGTTKLEYIVASGVKQVNLKSKIELESFLKLEDLKPLTSSYTQNDNGGDKTKSQPQSKDKTGTADPKPADESSKKDEVEVNDNVQDTE